MRKENKLLKSFFVYLYKNLSEIVFGIYFLFIMSASVFATLSGAGCGKYKYGICLFATLVLYTVFSLVPKIHSIVLKINFTTQQDFSKNKALKVFCFAGGITFAVLLACYAANYPGSYSPDSIYQYRQAVTGEYSDWHPVWHTLLFFTVPLKITGGWTGSIILFQIIYFSLLIGYFASTVYLYAGKLYAIISVALILLNPFTLEIVMYPWKDVAFAIVSGFCMLYAVHIYFTKGDWCKQMSRLVLFSFMLASATLFRHNGILFTFFLLIALFFYMKKRHWMFLVAMTTLLFLCVRVPLYSFLNVEKPAQRTLETMGLPLSVIVNVAEECPNRLDKDTSDFVNELTINQPNWKQYHNISGFNSMKWLEGGTNNDAIEKVGATGLLKMMCHCFKVAPKQACVAVGGLTIPVYGLEVACRAGKGITGNDLGIEYKGVKPLLFLEECYIDLITKSPLCYIFSCIGLTILVMLAFIIFRGGFRNFEDWKRIFLCIPIFTYDFGTMLLLSGHDVRFFYISFIIYPLIVLIMTRQQEGILK